MQHILQFLCHLRCSYFSPYGYFPMAEVAVLLYRTDINFEKLAEINEGNIEISVNVCNMGRVIM